MQHRRYHPHPPDARRGAIAIRVYLDTNVVAALLIPEPLSERAERFLSRREDELLLSNLSAAEFSSLVARRVRTRDFTVDEARIAFASFEAWIRMSTHSVEISAADLSAAIGFLQRLDLPLRTIDAIHIALAQRLDATLVTFDRQMAASARALGVGIASA